MLRSDLYVVVDAVLSDDSEHGWVPRKKYMDHEYIFIKQVHTLFTLAI